MSLLSHRSLRDIDWPLLLITLAICALGVLQIYSATLGTVFRDAWLRQSVYTAAGLVLFLIASRIDYHSLLGHSYWMYAVCLVALVAVFAIGTVSGGARRWIPLFGGFKLQVSEFVKIALVLLVARFLTDLKRDDLEWRDLLKIGALVGVPMLLVAKQPDLGTALTYLPILLAGVLLSGLRWQYIAVIALVGALALPLGWFVLHDYQRARLTSFVDPSSDPQGSGYQVIQSMIAVGHGGMWGLGVTRGTQTQLQFLPISHTDFIFSSFAEEHGFVGVVVVLGLYFLLLMQVVQNAQTAPDRAGMYICMSIAAMFLFHVLVNVGMVVGRMPVTGIPLPLMSFGGSNTLSVFAMLGLVNNVRLRRFVN
ncbi:MAG TPA: rod shape-determining protein RodA [Bryobacteraceae bacterium]|nr:rod shape-determining protein RodA [Bryobacteraceae bacterium]